MVFFVCHYSMLGRPLIIELSALVRNSSRFTRITESAVEKTTLVEDFFCVGNAHVSDIRY